MFYKRFAMKKKKKRCTIYITLRRHKMKGLIIHYVDRNNVSTSLDNFQNILLFSFTRQSFIASFQKRKKNCVGHYVVKPSTHTRHNTVSTFLDDIYAKCF
jgi:hypothetical protein